METIIVILLLVIINLLVQKNSGESKKEKGSNSSWNQAALPRIEVTEEEYNNAVQDFIDTERFAPWTMYGGPDPYMMEYIPDYDNVKYNRREFEMFLDFIQAHKELARKADQESAKRKPM